MVGFRSGVGFGVFKVGVVWLGLGFGVRGSVWGLGLGLGLGFGLWLGSDLGLGLGVEFVARGSGFVVRASVWGWAWDSGGYDFPLLFMCLLRYFLKNG